MEIVLSRILKYLNGSLRNDSLHKISEFIVHHYLEIISHGMELLDNEFSKEDIQDFCYHLGFTSEEDFYFQLVVDYDLRVSQIRSRMLGLNADDFLAKLDEDYEKKELDKQLEILCQLIFEKKRIILIGALYPLSIAVEFQTDMITFGKEVKVFHHFIQEDYTKDDIIIFLSATGRTLEHFINDHNFKDIDSQIILMTQNKKYLLNESLNTDYILLVPGKFDGIQFNYQIMLLFDILRIYYYQKYYLD